MEITIDTILSIAGLLLGGGGGAFFTWRYMRRKAKAEAQTAEVDMAKEVQDIYQQALADKDQALKSKNVEVEDKNRLINELREDRDHYKSDRNELRDRLNKMEDTVLELKREVARNGRMVEAMRPFLCYDTKCKKRVRVAASECEGIEVAAAEPLPTGKTEEPIPTEDTVKDIEPLNIKDM